MSIFELEEKYKNILENIEEWVYLRVALGHKLKNCNEKVVLKENKNSKLKKLLNNFKKLKNIFYGFKNWFGKYDYICFSDSGERKVIDNIYKDKISDDIIDRMNSNILLIELPNSTHYKNTYTKHIVSQSLLDIITFIYKKIFLKFNIENKDIDNILIKEEISFDYKNIIRKIKAEIKIYKILFSVYKPKAIFINCAYCRFGVVKAARDEGIDVIELQHGVITNSHYGYVSNIKVDNNYLPTKLLSFGLNEINMENLLIKEIIPIGSYYLNYLKVNFKPDKKLKSKIDNYKYVIGVSLQDQDWEYNGVLSFINNVASKNKEILYIIIPRKRRDGIMKSENIIVYEKLNCYDIILHCNIHVTLYSSCALEAPTLGIPNILININNFASLYYDKILDKYHTKMVDNEESFLAAISDMANLDKETIKLKNNKVFVSDYEKRINNFIKDFISVN
jgi:hypothetical protein